MRASRRNHLRHSRAKPRRARPERRPRHSKVTTATLRSTRKAVQIEKDNALFESNSGLPHGSQLHSQRGGRCFSIRPSGARRQLCRTIRSDQLVHSAALLTHRAVARCRARLRDPSHESQHGQQASAARLFRGLSSRLGFRRYCIIVA